MPEERKPDVILVGELHGEADHKKKESEIIRKEEPEYVLLERLGDCGLKESKDLIREINSSLQIGPNGDYSEILRAVEEVEERGKKIEVGGCDPYKNKVTGRFLVSLFNESDDSCEEFFAYLNEVNDEKEEAMSELITVYANKRESNRPVVAIMGSGHLRWGETHEIAGGRYSNIISNLRDSEIDHEVVRLDCGNPLNEIL